MSNEHGTEKPNIRGGGSGKVEKCTLTLPECYDRLIEYGVGMTNDLTSAMLCAV